MASPTAPVDKQKLKALIAHGNKLFESRMPLMGLWQTIGEIFCPQRAEFTAHRSLGREYTDHLTTGYPVLICRDLGDAIGSLLRRDQWFYTSAGYDDDSIDGEGRKWLEWATKVQYRAMYDRQSHFLRAAKELDHDFAAFGQGVMTCDLNFSGLTPSLLYRNHHLGDVAWCENDELVIDSVWHKWSPTVRTLNMKFPKTVHDEVSRMMTQNDGKGAYETVECMKILVPWDMYPLGENPHKHKWVSLYVDLKREHILEARPQRVFNYIIPRWARLHKSQYAFSPAVNVALPEARLMQAIALTLLEAGQKSVNPPLVATQQALRSDINLEAGAVTYVDADYDERLGEVLRPITQDKSGLGFGLDMQEQQRQILGRAFYLDKLSLPPPEGSREWTAFETQQRVQDYIRQALPLFEPLEYEENGQICDVTFETLLAAGTFGDPRNIPDSLKGREVAFKFVSPLSEMMERQKGQKLLETKALLAEAVALEEAQRQVGGAIKILDVNVALRDVLNGIAPQKWMLTERQMAEVRAQEAAQAQAQAAMMSMQQGAATAEMIGKAGESLGKMRQEQPLNG